MRWWDWLAGKRPAVITPLGSSADRTAARAVLAGDVRVADDPLTEAGWRRITESAGARPWHAVRRGLEEAAAVCRRNPLAARLVAMSADFVIGGGAALEGPPWAHAFWDHPQNRIADRLHRWCEELTRAGEIFIVLSRHPVDGMSYLREIPALQIDRIDTDPDDVERELRYHQLTDDVEGRYWPSGAGEDEIAEGAEGLPSARRPYSAVMAHYAINRPVGEVRGASDLAQILTWLERYDLWLEDRVRINRYKGAYLWHVKVEDALPGHLEAKRAQYARPPRSGSIIVTDGHETWSAVQPQIAADDAQADGRALRMMIAAGAGVPLHWLAEGEGANRATAREMGVAAYRHFEHRQREFAAMVEDVIRLAARRAGQGEIDVRVTFPAVHMAEALTPRADAFSLSRGTGEGAARKPSG